MSIANTANPRDLVELAHRVLKLAREATRGPWTFTGPDLTVWAEKPWRRVPCGSPGGQWEDYADVAAVLGGRREEAVANAVWIVTSRAVLPIFARALIRLLPGVLHDRQHDEAVEADESGAAGLLMKGENGDPVVERRASLPLPRKLPPDAAIWFTKAVADAIDDMVGRMGGHLRGLPLSDRNDAPSSRLLGDGDDARRFRAALLRTLADVIDPRGDRDRLRGVNAFVRTRHRGEPTGVDVYDALAEVVKDAATDLPGDAVVEEASEGMAKFLVDLLTENNEEVRGLLDQIEAETCDETLPTEDVT